MNILIVSPGQDTGGQGYRIKQAFDRYSDWHVRAMHASKSYIRYPGDLEWSLPKARELYDAADVVHHKNGLIWYAALDHGRRKPTVVHHQGTRLRDNPAPVFAEGESVGAVQLVSTTDLLDDAPGATWLPSPYDLDGIAARYPRRPHRRIRIGHSPTNRRAKGTAEILAALDRLSRRHDIEVDLIEGVEWRVCLSRKSQCDIFIDQITHGYGNNSVEAFAFGIPVVSGFAEPEDRARFVRETGVTPQFYEAGADIEERLEHLLLSRELREEWGSHGRAFAQMFHADHRVVERLKAIYAAVPASRGTLALYDRAPKRYQTAA